MKFKPGDLIRNVRTKYTDGDGPIYLVLSTSVGTNTSGHTLYEYGLPADHGGKDRCAMDAYKESFWEILE